VSRGPDKRKRTMSPASLANLKPGPGFQSGNAINRTHGARSEGLIAPLAEQYLAELQREFPQASERVLRLQARRLAKLERLAGWLEAHGEIRHQRRGEVFEASKLEESITAAFLTTQHRLEAQREQARSDRGATLARIVDAEQLG